jgi:hypothetical protein
MLPEENIASKVQRHGRVKEDGEVRPLSFQPTVGEIALSLTRIVRHGESGI